MSKTWITCLGVALLLAVPALGQDTTTTITATPNPATNNQMVTLTAGGFGACPIFGPVTVDGFNIRVELRTNCPFVPPPPEPFSLDTVVGPLDPGTYMVDLVLADDTLLATNELVVLDQAGCIPDATTLCLQDGRFQVTTSFQAANGQAGDGQAVPFSNESGLFTFFGADNLELLVKVLDRCGSAFNSFWVFSAGLTNVEVNITVFDLETGESRVYSNPLGNTFEAVLDTRAFETCP